MESRIGLRFHEKRKRPLFLVAVASRALMRLIVACVGGRLEAGFSDKPLRDIAPRSILVIRPDGIGDAVLTIPMLRALRHAYPDALITMLATAAAPLFVGCPYVDRVIESTRATQWRLGGYEYVMPAYRLARQELKGDRFDLAITPRWEADDPLAALVAFFSNAPRRLGHAELMTGDIKAANRRGLDVLYSDVVPRSSIRHETDQNLALLQAMGIETNDRTLELWPSAADEQQADARLANLADLPGVSFVAVAPGVLDPRRAWPEANFIELCGRLGKRHNVRFIVVGSENDEAVAVRMVTALSNAVIAFAVSASLCETASLIRRCALFIGNDSGPMHIAAAVGTPVIEISCHPKGGDDTHSNSPTRFAPLGVPNEILRPHRAIPPCRNACIASGAHCIASITVDDVLAAAERMLAQQ